jgi:acetyl esterase
MTLILWTLRCIAVLAVLAFAVYLAFQISPWPSALLVRHNLDQQGIMVARFLNGHSPSDVQQQLNERYDDDVDALLDVYTPSDQPRSKLPVVVWVHGGGWVAGSKDFIAGYLKVLASKGYAAVGVNYSLAPGKTYPTPVRQINSALAYLTRNAERLHLDPSKFVLAGDSAGAQIAAQAALIITSPSYATEMGIAPSIESSDLRGVILYCGFFEARHVIFGTSPRTLLWSNLRTMFWSYFGVKDFRSDPRLVQFSIIQSMTEGFPNTFISVGNADQLAPQSYRLAEIAEGRGVPVDKLFFPETYKPPLTHEYQFNLDSDAGKLALGRSLEFLGKIAAR